MLPVHAGRIKCTYASVKTTKRRENTHKFTNSGLIPICCVGTRSWLVFSVSFAITKLWFLCYICGFFWCVIFRMWKKMLYWYYMENILTKTSLLQLQTKCFQIIRLISLTTFAFHFQSLISYRKFSSIYILENRLCKNMSVFDWLYCHILKEDQI